MWFLRVAALLAFAAVVIVHLVDDTPDVTDYVVLVAVGLGLWVASTLGDGGPNRP